MAAVLRVGGGAVRVRGQQELLGLTPLQNPLPWLLWRQLCSAPRAAAVMTETGTADGRPARVCVICDVTELEAICKILLIIC